MMAILAHWFWDTFFLSSQWSHIVIIENWVLFKLQAILIYLYQTHARDKEYSKQYEPTYLQVPQRIYSCKGVKTHFLAKDQSWICTNYADASAEYMQLWQVMFWYECYLLNINMEHDPAKRLHSNASPLPMAGTIDVEIIRPIPSMVINCWQSLSLALISSISLVIVPIRLSSQNQYPYNPTMIWPMRGGNTSPRFRRIANREFRNAAAPVRTLMRFSRKKALISLIVDVRRETKRERTRWRAYRSNCP